MNKVYLVISFVILVLLFVFALMNAAPVEVNVLGLASPEPLLGLLIIGCALAGAVLMSFIDFARNWRRGRELKQTRAEMKKLRGELDKLRSSAGVTVSPKTGGNSQEK